MEGVGGCGWWGVVDGIMEEKFIMRTEELFGCCGVAGVAAGEVPIQEQMG